MTTLATAVGQSSGVGQSALWVLVIAVAAIVLIAVVALTATLLYLVRSVSLTVQQLRDVVVQGQLSPPDATPDDVAGGAAGPGSGSTSAAERDVPGRSETTDSDSD